MPAPVRQSSRKTSLCVNTDEKVTPEKETKAKKLPVAKAAQPIIDDQDAGEELSTTKETPLQVTNSPILTATV